MLIKRALLAFAGTFFFSLIAAADVLWDNGTFVTSGISLSIGWNQTATTPFRYAITDDFTLTSPAKLTQLTVWGYMTGNTSSESQIIDAYARFLTDVNGAPGDEFSGSLSEPRPFTATFTGSYYSSGTTRPIYRVDIDLGGLRLCPGTYWLQFNLDNNDIRPQTGTATANYFTTIVPLPPPEANGYHYDVLGNVYFILDDPNTGAGNQAPFRLEGDPLPTCAVAGDFDNDGICTPDDAPDFVNALLAGTFDGCADLNSDCEVNGLDVQAFVEHAL